MTSEEIQAEIRSGDSSRDITQDITKKKTFNRQQMILPHDSINLNELQQRSYYGSNQYVKAALDYIEKRKLNTAINRSPAYYISLTDNFHGNRLCIPYYDTDKKIVFYQTRSLDGTEPRYLNKVGCDKTLFGIERVDPNLDYIFLFEGPIDAMMVKNGVAVAGLTLTESQERQLAQFPFHQKIWVLDNLKIDNAAKEVVTKMILEGKKIFRWLDKPYKDFNEWAVAEDLNEIDYNIIIENLY